MPPAAAQPSPAPATACANPPRPVNPPQPSQPPAGLNPDKPGGASPASNLPPNTAWSPDRRRDAIRQAREQEKAERMLKILIDNRMDNINNNHSRQLF
jgi:hypothetical protein